MATPNDVTRNDARTRFELSVDGKLAVSEYNRLPKPCAAVRPARSTTLSSPATKKWATRRRRSHRNLTGRSSFGAAERHHTGR